eukprot:1284076-Prymnesium_polylepis.1
MWTATSVLPVPGGPCTRANSARQVSAMACSWEGFGAEIEGARQSVGICIRAGVRYGTSCSPNIAERKNADMVKGWSRTQRNAVCCRSKFVERHVTETVKGPAGGVSTKVSI